MFLTGYLAEFTWLRCASSEMDYCPVLIPVLLVEPLSSTGSASGPVAPVADRSAPPLFARLAGTMDSSEFLLVFMPAVPPEVFSDRSMPAEHR